MLSLRYVDNTKRIKIKQSLYKFSFQNQVSIPSLCQVVTCAVLVHLTVLVSSTYFTILGIEGIRADKYFISQHTPYDHDIFLILGSYFIFHIKYGLFV